MTAGRQHHHRQQQHEQVPRNGRYTTTTIRARGRRRRVDMSALASESELAGATGGVEDRTWKWRGYDIRYKVAGEVG